MPFTTFALPLFRPRRLDIALLLVLLICVHAMLSLAQWDGVSLAGLHADQAARQPWRLLSYFLVHPGWVPTVGNGVGLVVGMTMTARVAGSWTAWLGLLGGVLLPGLWLWFGLEGDQSMAGSSPALYATLGMGTVAWIRMRHELTYHRRRDRMAGFGTLGLVAFALTMPLLLQSPVRGVHAVGVVWGGLLVGLSPRPWVRRNTKAGTSFPGPGAQRGPANP